jgi:hypothetical protein
VHHHACLPLDLFPGVGEDTIAPVVRVSLAAWQYLACEMGRGRVSETATAAFVDTGSTLQ